MTGATEECSAGVKSGGVGGVSFVSSGICHILDRSSPRVNPAEGDQGSEDDPEEGFLTGGTVCKAISFTVGLGCKGGFGAIRRIKGGGARTGPGLGGAEGGEVSWVGLIKEQFA